MEKNSEVALTTVDNPWNPFTQFKEWYLYDVDKGYNSCSLLAYFAHTADSMSDEEINEEIERAIDEIIRYDLTNKFTKMFKKDSKSIQSPGGGL